MLSVTAVTAKLAIVVGRTSPDDDGCVADESTTVFATSPAGWADLPPTRRPTVASLVTDEWLVNVGVDGRLQRVPWAGGEIEVTDLPGTPALPLRVQGARRVGERFYVCGLFRQVFVSPDAVTWTTMNDGLDAGPGEEVTGLSNVAGNGTGLVAVGVHGTVFRGDDGGPWRRVPSGVRVWLKDVAWHGGAYWICGKGGVLLAGDARFSRVATGTTADLRALRIFRGDLYVLGDRGLWRVEGTSVVPVPTPGPPVAIDVCDEAMWMVADASTDSGPGQRHLFVSTDGRTFTRHE